MKKTRPCLVVSPDVMNQYLRTVLVAPMTTVQRPYPTRINVNFHSKRGQVALDQIRVVDRSRLRKKLGKVSDKAGESVSAVLVEIFQRG
jgi:mRNA interferase MazF